MDKESATALLMSLSMYYNDKSFENKVKREAWIKSLMELEYMPAQNAIDTIIKTHTTFMPVFADIYTAYQNEYKQTKEKITSDCPYCKGLGYIVHTKFEVFECYNGTKKSIPHQYPLYCTECQQGEQYKYSGRECKDHKTEYMTEPMTKYYKLDDLVAENWEGKPIPIPDYLREEARKHGMNINRLIRAVG